MRPQSRISIYLALGASLGVIAAYLLAGGASYKPLSAADPCESRPLAVLGERGILEGVALSGLDGAACRLGVSREELASVIADTETLNRFSAEHGIGQDVVDDAVRAGLLRAVDDAEFEGLLVEPVASIVRFIAENAPVGASLDAFRAIPGDPSLPEVLNGLGELGLSLDNLQGQLEAVGAEGLNQVDALLDALLGLPPE